MNRVETALVNSAPRRALQRLYEVPLLVRLGGRVPGGEFLAELARHGLHVGERWRTRVGGDYVLGVAHRDGPDAANR